MPNDNVLTAEARATIMDACQSISLSADALKDCHTVDGDWGDDLDAKAIYDAELNLLGRLTALLAAHPGQPEPLQQSAAAFNDEAREFLYGNLESIQSAIELADATGNCSQARGLEAVEYQIRRLFYAQPEPRAEETDAVRDVLGERRRQVEVEHWEPEHDDEAAEGQIALAAGCYALVAGGWRRGRIPDAWPWDDAWFKSTTPRRNLVKSAALAIAEIERLDRAAARAGDAS
ncbi:hypothetical protein [Burkholderia stabilis]|uniref:Uncharacterized protein n=1 Tax=Burkholderia stabilis TaxID=95485 RepID=A0AAJ5N3B0_9BURK|nr:hypothetical protein [Burkholderia stabilis]VBB10669.1 hypothetical protein BSTAB16_0776 [Burkholderia stabilis]